MVVNSDVEDTASDDWYASSPMKGQLSSISDKLGSLTDL